MAAGTVQSGPMAASSLHYGVFSAYYRVQFPNRFNYYTDPGIFAHQISNITASRHGLVPHIQYIEIDHHQSMVMDKKVQYSKNR